jgi:RND family efflux transporter MFP subunit
MVTELFGKQTIRWFSLGVMVILAILGCSKKNVEKTWQTSPVNRQNIRDVLTLSGVLEAIEEVDVKSEVSGQILRLLVQEGDSLTKGDTLLVIDPEQLRNRRVSNRLSLQRSRILYMQAARNFTLAESLKAVHGISDQKIKDSQWAAELAKLQVQQDSLSLAEIEIQLGKTAVVAPISGFLIGMDVKEGEVIVAGTASVGGGTTLGTISDLSTRQVTVKISELDYPNIYKGQNAFVSTAAKPGTRFPGQVSYVSRMAKLEASSSVRQFEVRVTLDTLDSDANKVLPPGATVSVEFTLVDVANVLTIPYEAMRTQPGEDGAFVMVLEGKKPVRKSITIGANNFNRIEIKSGLNESELVITEEAEARGKGPRGAGKPRP